MEREVGGGIGMGNTCKPMAVSFQCMTKSTTKKKKRLVFLVWNKNYSDSKKVMGIDWGSGQAWVCALAPPTSVPPSELET